MTARNVWRRHGIAGGFLTLGLLSACGRATPSAVGDRAPAYRLATAPLALPGDGSWDHIAAAPAIRRAFVSHDTHIDVLDLDADTLVGTVSHTPGVHGVALALATGRGYSSNGGDSSLTVFDVATLLPRGRVRLTTAAPDGIAYDSVSRRVFVLHDNQPSLSVVDAGPDTVRRTLALGGMPDGAEPDGRGGVFVSLKDKSELLKIDARALTLVARWALAPCEGPDAMTFDASMQRLLIGCDNRIAVEVDPANGHVVSTFAIGEGVDGIAVDPANGTVLVACGDGSVTVARRAANGAYRVLDRLRTERGAKTAAFDPVRGTLLLPTARFVSAASDDPTGRHSAVIPASFHVLMIQRR